VRDLLLQIEGARVQRHARVPEETERYGAQERQ
jgi:hypothetical protein